MSRREEDVVGGRSLGGGRGRRSRRGVIQRCAAGVDRCSVAFCLIRQCRRSYQTIRRPTGLKNTALHPRPICCSDTGVARIKHWGWPRMDE